MIQVSKLSVLYLLKIYSQIPSHASGQSFCLDRRKKGRPLHSPSLVAVWGMRQGNQLAGITLLWSVGVNIYYRSQLSTVRAVHGDCEGVYRNARVWTLMPCFFFKSTILVLRLKYSGRNVSLPCQVMPFFLVSPRVPPAATYHAVLCVFCIIYKLSNTDLEQLKATRRPHVARREFHPIYRYIGDIAPPGLHHRAWPDNCTVFFSIVFRSRNP